MSTKQKTKPPPGPRGRRLHNFRQRTTNYTGFVNQLRREHGDIVSYRLPFMKCCVVFDAELIREVLVTQQAYFRPWFPGDLTEDFKYGSIALHQGEEHRRRSELMASAFAGDSEGAYAEIVAEKALAMRERFLSRKVVDLVDEFDLFVWDSVVEIVLGRGVRLPRQLGEDTLSLAQLYLLIDLFPGARLVKSMPLPALRSGRKSVALVNDAIYGSIERARDASCSGSDIAAKYARAMDREDAATPLDCAEAIRDELVILLTGQIDGPTSALTFGVHYLARNPDVRMKVEREVDAVLNGGSIDGADYGRLPYINAVFNEVLRIDPPTSVMLPKEATEDRMLGDHLIRKGTLVHVAMKALHHQPEYWDRPSEFRPERWLDNQRPPCPADTYIPFGLGPHFCQGMEVARRIFVLGIASLAQKLRLEPWSTDPPNRNNIAVGVVSPWTAEVHKRQETNRRPGRGSTMTESRPDSSGAGAGSSRSPGTERVLLAKGKVTINAAPDTVFATLAHGGRHGAAHPEVESVEFVSEETMGVGARFREARDWPAVQVFLAKLAGLYRNVIECTEFEPGRRVTYTSDGAGTMWDSVYTFTQAGEGRTEVELRLETRPKNLLGRWVPQGLKRPLGETTRSELEAIKAYFERDSS